MAQILKYSGGGTSPKPIKIGSKYYTKELLMTDLYGDKLDEYIKFREFNSKEAANFRKNLDNQVNALIDGRLTLNGNTLIDSKGEWSNTGEYAKPKLFGKLNEEQIKNNESLDVANYLVRALNSNKIATYVAPSQYNLFESDAFKTYNDMLGDTDWLNEDVTKRRNRIAQSLEDEADKLEKDSSYQGKYSYEGWQDVDWDTRANATILKLRDAAKTLKDSTINGLDLKLQLGLLGYGDLANYLEKEEVPAGSLSNNGSQNENQEVNQDPSKNIAFKIIEKNLFDFTAPKFKYKGKEYTYGTDEANKILGQTFKGEDGNPITIAAYLELLRLNANLIDRTHIDFATVPTAFKYFTNVTNNFVNGSARGTKDVRAAYILRKDPLDPTGSIIKIIYHNSDGLDRGNAGYYRYDLGKLIPVGVNTDNGDVYDLKGEVSDLKAIEEGIQGNVNAEDLGEYTTDLIFRGGDFNVENLDKFISNSENIRLLNSNKLNLRSYITSLRKALLKTAYTDKRRAGVVKDAEGKDVYYIDIFGTNDKRPLRIYFKSEKYRNLALKDNDFDATRVRAVNLPIYYLTSNANGIAPDYKFPTLNKEGGILFAQMGVLLDDSPVKVSEVKVKPEKKSKKLNGREMTLSSTNNYNKELEAGVDFDSRDARRLAYSLIDLGSAVASLIPGASLASTAVGVGMTGATAVEDFSDAFKGKMSLGEAAWNTVSSLGLDAMSIIPGLKAAKIGKNLKFVLKAVPRLIGYALAYNMLSTESAAAIGKTMGKISSGNFDLLTTLDFNNITHAIRIATMIGRDAKGTYRKGRNMLGKKTELVEISGKVNGLEIKTTVNREDITTSKFKIKRIDLDKVKLKLAEEANRREDITKKPLVLEKNAEGKLLTNEDGSLKMKLPLFEVGDVKSTNTSTIRDHNLYESEVGHPKKLFEGWFGYKGYNSPISDAYIAQRWDPILRLNGQMTNKRAALISQTDKRLAVSPELKQKVDLMVSEKKLSRKLADEILEGGPSRKQFIELEALKAGVTPTEYIRDSYNLNRRGIIELLNKFVSELSSKKIEELNKELTIRDNIARSQEKKKERHIGNATKKEAAKAAKRQRKLEENKTFATKLNLLDATKYANEVLLGVHKAGYSIKNSKKLIQKVLNKYNNAVWKFGPEQFKQDLLDEVNSSLKLRGSEKIGKGLVFNNEGLVEEGLIIFVDEKKQGGRLERGLLLIKAYKSGGLVIPKFKEGNEFTLKYQYNPDVYYVNDIADYNTTTLSGNQLTDTWAKKGTNSASGNREKLYGATTLQDNITHLDGLNYFKNYVIGGKWAKAVQKYIKENGAYAYNLNISKLRNLRARFEGKEHLYKNEDVAEYNKLFNDIFGPDYHTYSDELKDIYGQATNLRHVLSFTSKKEKENQRKFNINGKDYWLDNAGYLREGEYGKPKVIKPEQVVEDSQNVLVNGAKTETDAGAGSGGGTGSTQYTSNQFKTKTRPNPIQLLRMAELAGALGTNAAATNELLKYRSYSLDAPYKLAYLYDKYPLIAATQNQVGSLNTQTSIPTTADLGSYFSNKLTGFSKGLTAMLNIYNENYNTFLTSKAGVQEAANYNNAAEVEAGNNNVARAVTAENMKDKVRADLYSTNFAQGIKPFLSETRQYMQDAEKLRQKSAYDVLSAIAKQKYDNDIAAINENYVSSIDKGFLKANEGKSDAAIIQAWLNAHPDKAKEYKALLETPTMDYYKSQAKLYEILAPNIGFLNTSTLAYNYESGGKLTAKDRIKIQKIKDYNAARRQDSKESLKSITKDKEEFGKNYRALSAGTLKMLERTLK